MACEVYLEEFGRACAGLSVHLSCARLPRRPCSNLIRAVRHNLAVSPSINGAWLVLGMLCSAVHTYCFCYNAASITADDARKGSWMISVRLGPCAAAPFQCG
jgi:hypothetical protein